MLRAAHRPKVVGKERGVRGESGPALHIADVETAQPLGKMARDIRDGFPATMAVRVGEIVQQSRRGNGQRDLQMERQGIFIESGHGGEKNK